MPRPGNPKAKEAMKLVHSRGITLKQAWDHIKSGKESHKSVDKKMIVEEVSSYKPKMPMKSKGYKKV